MLQVSLFLEYMAKYEDVSNKKKRLLITQAMYNSLHNIRHKGKKTTFRYCFKVLTCFGYQIL